MIVKSKLATAIISAGLVSTTAHAGTVTTGQLIIDFDEAAWLALPTNITHSAWHDEKNSADKTIDDLVLEKAQTSVPDKFIFNVFGETIPASPKGLAGRKPVASTFSYTDEPETGTGKIGFAGVHKLTGLFEGALVYGDYDLRYDESRLDNAAEGSGWYLTNNISFSLPAYDLTNVESIIIDDNNFSLSGDVVLTAYNALMLMSEEGTRVGNFTFTTKTSTPKPVILEDIRPPDVASATYSSATQTLTIPVVSVNGVNQTATLDFASSPDGSLALYLIDLSITPDTSTLPAIYDALTHTLTLPIIEVVDANGTVTSLIKATLKQTLGSSPLQFLVTTIEDI
ncbi:MAG: hypothetical protein KAG19_04800 [Methylococcales bacterium]|nr:hypothetical protein [Methylococcales bacterium]